MKTLEIIKTNGDWNASFRYENTLKKFFLALPNKNEIRLVDLKDIPEDILNSFNLNDLEWEQNSYSAPIKAQIQLNNTCNYRCKMCYASSNMFSKEILTFEEIELIVEKLKNLGVLRINLVGGEIFVRSDIIKIIKYIKNKNLFLSCITNGLVPGLQIDKYKEVLELFYQVQVSCNGIGDSYLNEYGMNNWGIAKKAISNVIKYTSNNILSFVITENNYKDIPHFFEFASEINPTYVKFGTIIWMGKSKKEEANKYYKEILIKANELINECRLRYPNINVQSQLDFEYDIDTFQIETNEYRPAEFYYSSEGKDSLYIKADGSIYPFPLFSESPEFRIGSIHDDFEDIWKNSQVLNDLRSVKFKETDCGKIGCKKICGFWVRSYAYAWSSNLYGKVPCKLTNYE